MRRAHTLVRASLVAVSLLLAGCPGTLEDRERFEQAASTSAAAQASSSIAASATSGGGAGGMGTGGAGGAGGN
ncbi:MAG: hypothetical protein FJ095_03750 [Deltaproteobacteria bacterium]|nr:hypothetical protein [Deltaproteobacteria bacterium]